MICEKFGFRKYFQFYVFTFLIEIKISFFNFNFFNLLFFVLTEKLKIFSKTTKTFVLRQNNEMSFTAKYNAPAWMPVHVQRLLKNPTDPSDVFIRAKDLFEGSGGTKTGFTELLRFCQHMEHMDLCPPSFWFVAEIWNKMGPVYNPWTDEEYSCKSCKTRVFEGGYCNGCADRHQQNVVVSMIDFVLKFE